MSRRPVRREISRRMVPRPLQMWGSGGILTPTSCESQPCSYPHVVPRIGARQQLLHRPVPRSVPSHPDWRATSARGGLPMHCPFCRPPTPAWSTAGSPTTAPRSAAGGSARRATGASRPWRQMQLTVVKRSGATEPFSREKVVAGVRKACKGRRSPRTTWPGWRSGSRTPLRASGAAPRSPAHEVGLAILGPLRELDEVAYLRFATRLPGLRDRRGLRGRDRAAASGARTRARRSARSRDG